MGVGKRNLVRISLILLFPDRIRVKPYPSKQKIRGVKICPQGQSAWACLLGKNGAFLETPETRFLAITWVSGTLQYAPKAYPVKFYGLKCWGWAVVGSDSYGPSVSSCNNRFSDSCRDKKAEAFWNFPAKRGSNTGPWPQIPGPSPKWQ